MSRRQSAGDLELAAVRAGSRNRRWSLADLFFRPKHDQSADTAPLDAQPKHKGPVLMRRRSSPETSAKVRPVPAKDRPAPARHKTGSQRRQPKQPRRVYIDLRDSSDVWLRRSVKDKLSLNPVRPRTLFQGVELPRFLKALSGHSDSEHRTSHARKKTRSLKRRPRSRQGTHTPNVVVMPEPVLDSPHQTVRFSEPASPLVRMPIPTHFTADGVPDTDPASSLLVDPAPSNRISIASADDDAQTHRVFQVLERRNTRRGHTASQPSDAMSPILVTIARDGSIISDLTSRQSDDQARRTPSSDLLRDIPAAQQMPSTRQGVNQRTRMLSASPASIGVSTSQGTDSFVTAQMFPSARMSEECPARSPELCSVAEESRNAALFQRRQSDEVSDIAMRTHLLVDQDADAGSRVFSEWLHAQANEPHSIAQAISQATEPLHSKLAGSAAHVSQMPHQQHYCSLPNSHDAHGRHIGSEQKAIIEELLTRISDLESQFTCMEAVMVSMEDRFFGRPSAPARSLSIRRSGNTAPTVGKTPIVRAVPGLAANN
ncbi:hypothetical protein GGH12_003048 [Coemansia sp. RSA 1822]|nr:hypothetical protein LPJ76_002750 [Coemansia sp. RSA 638]KAJ2562661.1 hypothetical protein GGH12_003048 [Coemansia sp. RSA 1822]